jgi:hypothetical protein
MDAEDAEAYAKAAIEDPDIPVSADDIADFYGFGSPTQGVTGAQGGFKGFGGEVNLRDSIADINRTFNKEGIPKEFVPYYNSLKDRGLTNEQAMATLAAVAGTPGGAASLTSGYTDGYSYGGPMGTLEDLIETGQTASLEQRAKKAKEKADKERSESDDFLESEDYFEEPGVMDRFANILGLDDFSLASLNPLSNKLTSNQQAIMQSYKDQGLTVQQRSPMDYALGFMGSAMLPTELGAAKFVAERATDTDIIGLATDPVTGFEYLVESGGGLQLAADQLGDAPNQDAGNEPTPTITKKRKEETKSDPEDITKNVNKPGFPQQKLPRLTPFGQTELANIYGSDDPLFNKYATGIQALV